MHVSFFFRFFLSFLRDHGLFRSRNFDGDVRKRRLLSVRRQDELNFDSNPVTLTIFKPLT